MFKPEHDEYCKEIADQLEAVVNGVMMECPHCGNYTDKHNYYDSDSEICVCEHCGETIEGAAEANEISLYDYLADEIFDMEYTVSIEYNGMTLRGCKIMIACGGPNIYLNTNSGDVELFWWNEQGRYSMDTDVIEALDEFAREMLECNGYNVD